MAWSWCCVWSPVHTARNSNPWTIRRPGMTRQLTLVSERVCTQIWRWSPDRLLEQPLQSLQNPSTPCHQDNTSSSWILFRQVWSQSHKISLYLTTCAQRDVTALAMFRLESLLDVEEARKLSSFFVSCSLQLSSSSRALCELDAFV